MVHDVVDEDAQSLLVSTFSLGGRVYALPTTHIQESVRVGELTPVRGAPGFILGIINLRGKIVTVLDLAAKVLMGSVDLGEESRIIILEWSGEHVGLAVDEVIDVFRVDPGSVVAAPANVQECHARYLAGVFPHTDGLIPMLDAQVVLADDDAGETAASRHNGGGG